jgi:hypothetical protein
MVNAIGGQGLRRTRLLCLGIALMMAACQASPQQASCPLPGQTRMISLKLYFGRNIPGGGFVTDAAWSSFAATVLTPAFPDGFTAYDALGQWRDPSDGHIVREKSFVVEAAGPMSPARILPVASAYRKTFRQVSVGQVSQEVCAVF